MKVPTRTLHQPVVDQLGFVGGRVVEHEVHVEIAWDGRLDLIEEVAELDRTMPACAVADHRPGLDVEGGEQVGRTLATIIVSSALRLAGPHRQHGGRARQRLDLRLLVDAQHHGTMRRSQVQANDVPDLVDEGGIGRELEGVGLVQLQPEGALSLPGPFDVRGQLEALSTVWAQDRWDEAGEQSSDDGLPHGG